MAQVEKYRKYPYCNTLLLRYSVPLHVFASIGIYWACSQHSYRCQHRVQMAGRRTKNTGCGAKMVVTLKRRVDGKSKYVCFMKHCNPYIHFHHMVAQLSVFLTVIKHAYWPISTRLQTT